MACASCEGLCRIRKTMKGFFSASKVQLERPIEGMIPRCGSCGLYKTCNTPKMVPFGKGEKRVLVVGEAPGQTEDEEGRPFIGKAGEYLREVLSGIGVRLDKDALTTNALICRPPDNKIPNEKCIDYCRPNLLNTLKEFEPRVIVLLGKSALSSLMPLFWTSDLGTLERWVGWKIPAKKYWICPTYHPSYLLRVNNSLMDKQFAAHLAQAFAIDEDPPIDPKDLSPQIEIIYDDRVVYKVLREFDEQRDWVAVDYETNCLKPEYPKAEIVSCSVSNGERTISYPWIGHAITATSMLLRSNRTKKIAANMKFEDRFTRKLLGVSVANWGWDTMLATHCMDNRPDICSLKFQGLVQFGVPTYNTNVEPYLSNQKGSPYNTIRMLDPQELLLYGGIDGLLEHRLAMKQRKEAFGL